jgi:hypothetical protein
MAAQLKLKTDADALTAKERREKIKARRASTAASVAYDAEVPKAAFVVGMELAELHELVDPTKPPHTSRKDLRHMEEMGGFAATGPASPTGAGAGAARVPQPPGEPVPKQRDGKAFRERRKALRDAIDEKNTAHAQTFTPGILASQAEAAAVAAREIKQGIMPTLTDAKSAAIMAEIREKQAKSDTYRAIQSDKKKVKAAQHEAERAKRAVEAPVLAYKAKEDFVTSAAEEVAHGEAVAVTVKKANLDKEVRRLLVFFFFCFCIHLRLSLSRISLSLSVSPFAFQTNTLLPSTTGPEA